MLFNEKAIKPIIYVPQTPASTDCFWLKAKTKKEAWANLLKNAVHMPYNGEAGFEQRGYTVNEWDADDVPY